MSMNYVYYKVSFKLLRKMLGTCSAVSIWAEHILAKAKKLIAEANKLKGKVNKTLKKYVGSEITEHKEIAELQGIIRRYQEITGEIGDIPNDVKSLLEYATVLEEKFNEMCKSGETAKSTIFMRNKEGFPIISTHMIIGNFKENLKIITNNSGDAKAIKSKVAAKEIMVLDVKPVEEFMVPSNDVEKDANGKPILFERPIRFDDGHGKQETAIAMSEVLPEGTEFSCTLRVRADSSLNEDLLRKLLDLGKNNGLGQNRGSGYGSYCFKLEKIDDPTKKDPNGWE